MLAAAALRLAAIEALAPTAAIASGQGFPTMALHHVYDSRAISSAELEHEVAYTPSLSVYTEDTRVARRGDSAPNVIGFARTDLVIVAELAELACDEAGEVLRDSAGTAATDAVINGDPGMHLVLAALVAQVRAVLLHAPRGAGFRRVLKSVQEIRIEPFGLPQYGIRFMRQVMTIGCEIADDQYSDAAGLPEPARSVARDLPDQSYAKSRLLRLAEAFAATTRPQLEALGLHVTADGVPIVPPAGES